MLFISGCVVFLWKRCDEISLSYKADTSIWGQFGDYIGGVIGTFVAIISVFLLYRTLKLQIKATKKSTQTSQQQQLNDKFFHLIEIYNKTLQNINYTTTDDDFFTGKIALHRKLQDIADGFDNNVRTGMLRKNAVFAFVENASLERDTLPVYFRTLYRVFDVIYNSDADKRTKVEYAKIVRAQLTDTELVMLRYNAMTPAGSKFVFYINHYNLLKHLPPLEMLEFKNWKKLIGESQSVMRANEVLLSIKKLVSQLLDGDKLHEQINSINKKYIVQLETNEIRSIVSLTLIKDASKQIYPTDNFAGFDKMGMKEISDMLSYYFRECFILMNFNKYNNRKKLSLSDTYTNTSCTIEIRNTANEALAIKETQVKKNTSF